MAISFEELPDEIKLRIFSFLSQYKLTRISLVCKEWCVLSKDPHLWKRVIIKYHEHKATNIVRGLQRCTLLEKLAIKFMEVSDSLQLAMHLFNILPDIPSLKVLIFHFKCMDWEKGKLSSIVENNLLIQGLGFENCYILFPPFDFFTHCATLVHLKEFTLVNCLCDIDDTCIEILSKGCPKLEILDIETASITEEGVKELALNSKANLHKLTLMCGLVETLNNGFVHLGTCQKLISLKLTGFWALSETSLKALSELPFLETLFLSGSEEKNLIRFADQEQQTEKGFEFFFSNPFRARLRKVDIRYLSVGETALINMSQTCPNLKDLFLYRCFGITKLGVGKIFKECSELKSAWIKMCVPLADSYRAKRYSNGLRVFINTSSCPRGPF